MPRMQEPSPPKAGPGSSFPAGQARVQGKTKRRLKKKAKRVAVLPQKDDEDEFSSFPWTDTTEDLLTLLMPSAATSNTSTTNTTTAANVVSTVKKKKKQKQNQKKRVNFFDSDSSSTSSNHDDDIKTAKKTDSPAKRSTVPQQQSHTTKAKKPFPSTIPATKAAKTAASAKKNATQKQKQLQKESSYSDLLSSPSVKERMRSLPSAKKEAKNAVPPVLTPTKAAAPLGQQQQRRATVTIQKAKPKMATQTSKKATTAKAKGVSTPHASAVKTNRSAAAPTKAPSTNANSASTSSLMLPQPPQPKVPAPVTSNRCALAIDTRFIDTPLGQEFGADWIDECDSFLHSLSSRGAHPHILACSARKEKSTAHTSRKRFALTTQIVVDAPNIHYSNDNEDDDDIYLEEKEEDDARRVTPAWIPPPPNMENTDRKAVKVPKHLLANESWTHFGELVEKIIEEDAKTKPSTSGTAKKRRPLDVTIVSNDVSLFCDTKDASHKRALSRFWDLIKPYFQFEDLMSIHIVILKTGTIAMAKPINEKDSNNKTTTKVTPESDKGNNAEAMDSSMEHSDDFLLEQMEQDEQENAEEEARSLYEMDIAKCVRSLQAQLRNAAEKDCKLSLNAKKHIPQVEISISMIDATANTRLAFKDLLRRSLRDIVTSNSAVVNSMIQNNVVSTANRIHLQLPETIDGTQCSVALDISYKLLPFALDRPGISAGFFCDLTELCASNLKVLQLVPFSSVDTTFLFGVPMRVRAGLEGDYEQYQEAHVLTRSLFKTMQAKQVAMLIQIADDSQIEKSKKSNNKCRMSGVFHNDKRGQTFLLMAEEPVGGQSPPSTGVLFRYASADDLLLEADPPATKVDVPDEIVNQYESYVENAFDILDCNAVNPLFLDATENAAAKAAKHKWNYPMPPPHSTQQSNDDNRWNDDEGVGALDKTDVGFLRAIAGETLSVEEDDDDDDDDDDGYQGFNSFLYSQED